LEVNDILDANLKNLKKIYEKYDTSLKHYLTLEDIYTLINRDAAMEILEADLKYCFAMSKMAVTNELTNS